VIKHLTNVEGTNLAAGTERERERERESNKNVNLINFWPFLHHFFHSRIKPFALLGMPFIRHTKIDQNLKSHRPWNTKGGSITVLLTSCLTVLD